MKNSLASQATHQAVEGFHYRARRPAYVGWRCFKPLGSQLCSWRAAREAILTSVGVNDHVAALVEHHTNLVATAPGVGDDAATEQTTTAADAGGVGAATGQADRDFDNVGAAAGILHRQQDLQRVAATAARLSQGAMMAVANARSTSGGLVHRHRRHRVNRARLNRHGGLGHRRALRRRPIQVATEDRGIRAIGAQGEQAGNDGDERKRSSQFSQVGHQVGLS